MSALPLVSELGDPNRSLLDDVRAARASVSGLQERPLREITDLTLSDAVREVAALRSQVEALELTLAAEAERRHVEREEADTGTDAWLSKLTGERREVSAGALRTAGLLHGRYRATADALASGRIRLTQARVIVDGLEPSAGDATPTQQARAEELLIAKATGEGTRSGVPMSAPNLRRAARRVYRSIDPELSERHLARTVKANNQRGLTSTWLTIRDNGDGTCGGRFQIPEHHGRVLRTVLESLSAPRRFGRDGKGQSVVDDTVGGDADAPSTDGTGLSWCDRMGLAFCEILEHVPVERLPKSLATLLVRIDLDTLRSDLETAGIGTTSAGADLPADEVRRLGCEAGIVPAVMNGASVPLDLGRSRRLHSEKQRQAYALIYDSCAIAGCDRPFSWTEIHHLQPWSEGGPTDLSNGLPLCWHHHRAAHDKRFELIRHDETEWVLRRRKRRC